MSTNAFMPPALPQTPAPDLNSASGKSRTAFKSNRLGETSDQGKSFSATLNQISDRNHQRKAKSAAAQKPAVTSRDSDTESVNPEKRSKTNSRACNDIEDSAASASASKQEIPSIHPLQAFGWMHHHLFNISMADDGSLAVEPPSDSTAGTDLFGLTDLIGHLLPQGHPAQREQVGIGPFEQLPADISPEAHNLNFFKQLAARAIHHQLADADAHPLKFWGDLAATPAGEGSPGDRAEALINYLLNRHANTSATWGLEATTAESNGQKAAMNVAVPNANENLLFNKMTGALQPSEADRAEMNKSAILATHLRQGGENSQAPRPSAAPIAAEQAVNPNLAAEGVSAKPSEDALSFKSLVLQNEMQLADQSGSKVMQIDGDAKDSSFLTSQDQLPEHLAKLDHAARSAEVTQRSLTSQTMNQIVQKAVLLQNNGQHEVQIDLKPDFLGHIRMQIVTESHQVAVRIVAELPLVKDLLESNLSQLKAELQSQGLEVDELEVSVAHDSRADDDKHQKAAEMRRARALRNSRLSVGETAEEQADGHTGPAGGMAETAIDYFA